MQERRDSAGRNCPLAMQLALISDDAKRNPAQLAKDVGVVDHSGPGSFRESELLRILPVTRVATYPSSQ